MQHAGAPALSAVCFHLVQIIKPLCHPVGRQINCPTLHVVLSHPGAKRCRLAVESHLIVPNEPCIVAIEHVSSQWGRVVTWWDRCGEIRLWRPEKAVKMGRIVGALSEVKLWWWSISSWYLWQCRVMIWRMLAASIDVYMSASSSPSPQAFPIIWGRRNGYEYTFSTFPCQNQNRFIRSYYRPRRPLLRPIWSLSQRPPVRSPPLTLHFPYLFYKSLSIWFSVLLSVTFLGVSNILHSTRVASHHARSDTPSITCVVARLSCSDPQIIIIPLRPMARLRVCRSREMPRRLQDLHAEFNFT